MRIKGFDENLCCRGMQYEIGKEYTTDGKDLTSNDLCTNKVLHYCDSIQKVNYYYSCCDKSNRYCEIEVLGEEVTNGDKYGSNHIKIVREIIGEELELLKGHINGNTGLFNTGSRNSGHWNSGNNNSGNYNSGNWNSGDSNHGSHNSGHGNSGDYNSGNVNRGNWNIGNCNNGDYNNGDLNIGNLNSGYGNSGSLNSGHRNSGNRNSGNRNSGQFNSGHWNSGLFNSCNRSNGILCDKDDDNIRIFNIPSGMSYGEFIDSKYYRAIISSPFTLTEWIDYTDEEKKESERKAFDEGYLKKYTYKEACGNWWKNMTEDNKEIIKSIPNFDAEVFEHITGIKV